MKQSMNQSLNFGQRCWGVHHITKVALYKNPESEFHKTQNTVCSVACCQPASLGFTHWLLPLPCFPTQEPGCTEPLRQAPQKSPGGYFGRQVRSLFPSFSSFFSSFLLYAILQPCKMPSTHSETRQGNYLFYNYRPPPCLPTHVSGTREMEMNKQVTLPALKEHPSSKETDKKVNYPSRLQALWVGSLPCPRNSLLGIPAGSTSAHSLHRNDMVCPCHPCLWVCETHVRSMPLIVFLSWAFI